MSEDESMVQSIVPLLRPHFINKASRFFKDNVNEFEFIGTATKARQGASGKVLISKVHYETEHGRGSEDIALKFFENPVGAVTEIKNAMNLEIKFRAAPEFGIPKVIYASTKDPVLIIYEGINATNYDEIEIAGKAKDAGRLLSTIHGPLTKTVDSELYRFLAQKIGTYIAETGMEKDIAEGLGFYFQRIEGSLSGCNPFSDFHQSNVMIAEANDIISKVYIIDPEFMQVGSFDRFEDIGTFFGNQMFLEFTATGAITKGIEDLRDFLTGYQVKNLENGGMRLVEMYPKGTTLPFFIGQWALMDAIDIALNRGGTITSGEAFARIQFVQFVLDPANESAFRFG
ncbi:MAG: hypothetical protein IH840_12770 [Candidatus Heimdallarchaeota archaeon]|nr:hypothetical protein [Candidatus Heimdallarchaeota archaeon]